MSELTCPICGRKFEHAAEESGRYFPFCSKRCQLVDLDNWLEGRYRIVEELAAAPEGESEEGKREGLPEGQKSSKKESGKSGP